MGRCFDVLGDDVYTSQKGMVQLTVILNEFLSKVHQRLMNMDKDNDIWNFLGIKSSLLSGGLEILEILLQERIFEWLNKVHNTFCWISFLFHIDCESKFETFIRIKARTLWMQYHDYQSREWISKEIQDNLVYWVRQTESCSLR